MILRPRQTAVPDGTANDKATSRIDVIFRALVDPLLRQNGLEDLLDHGLAQCLRGNVGTVLGRQHDGLEAHRLVILVAQGDLALGVRAQPVELALLADIGLLLHEAVRQRDRRRHQHVRLVRRIAEHQALVTGALLALVLTIHALRDVGGLLTDDVDDTTAGAVETHVR